MNSHKYANILNSLKTLSNSTKRKLIIDINKTLIDANKNIVSKPLACPNCGGNHTVKNGKNKDSQRYLCKFCRKSFVKTTYTPIYYSKKDISIWIKFIDCLNKQYSLRKISKSLHIALSTAFFWRHKILDALREHANSTNLTNEIILNEIYFKESFKGNHSHDNFVLPRKPYSNPTNSPALDFAKERVCIISALDSYGNLFLSPITTGKPSSSDLLRSLGNKIQKNSFVFAKSSYCYKTLSAFCYSKYININQIDCSIPISQTDEAFKLHIKLNTFFKPYNGVATKYLSNYLALFTYTLKKSININFLFTKGNHSYLNTDFKGRLPIFS